MSRQANVQVQNRTRSYISNEACEIRNPVNLLTATLSIPIYLKRGDGIFTSLANSESWNYTRGSIFTSGIGGRGRSSFFDTTIFYGGHFVRCPRFCVGLFIRFDQSTIRGLLSIWEFIHLLWIWRAIRNSWRFN